ncbi:hypothetical protein WA026_005170 [Henosepilachna vigintioctopunctata]|uniref:OPA3-like protein n=1 Tax=Henosepilachna vigintioctopunctata TaxID=420089 RepID=A0AAW1UT64_9CUCU
MVVGAFPVAKLGALLLKQISKPIANAVKEQAKTSPVFRKYVCLPPAQFYNWCEEKAKMWVLNLGKPVSVPIYNEKMAIELGANLLGEGIIFIIAAGIVIAEYSRSARKEAAKEEDKKREMEDIKMALKELFIQTEEQAAYIRELRRKVGDLDTKLGQKSSPTKPKADDYPPPTPPRLLERPDQDPKIIKTFKEDTPDLPLNLCVTQDSKVEQEPKQWSNVLLHAVREIENEFWNYSLTERRPGILNNALNHLCENVYKADITTCT